MRFLNLELQKKKKNGSTFNLNPNNNFLGTQLQILNMPRMFLICCFSQSN
jgi:hypothetical protein